MSTKSEIVVCRASYRKVFSASFRRTSFSTATPVYNIYMQPSPTDAQIRVRDSLEAAIRDRDSNLVEATLFEAFTIGLHPVHTTALIVLADADWHLRQEDVVGALQDLRSPSAVDVLERCAFSVHEHLAYDDNFGLARKCTWAIADIGTNEAREALRRIANCDNSTIAGYAKKRLDNWEKELHRKGA